jgi:predicted HD superfamily hydrolase involved in NAD metabolism
MDLSELCRHLDPLLDERLSPERASHSRRVAETAARLCAREGLDPDRGRAAGLAHDLCKEMPRKVQRELAFAYADSKPGSGLSSAQTSSLMEDKVVHGPAAAALLARDFSVDDDELLEAIALHTVGKPGMGILSVIVYCADKLEPGRERLDDAERESCLALPLGAMLLAVVEGVVRWMRSKGRAVAPETLILYSTLVREADPR